MEILINNSNTNYDIALLAISTLAATAMLFISFDFLDRLYRSKDKIKGALPIAISFVAGTGLWANHQLVLLSTNFGVPTQLSWALLHSWLFGVSIAACIVYLTGVRDSKLRHLIVGGLVSGVCDFGLFFTSLIAINATREVTIDPLMGFTATLYTTIIASLTLIAFQWVKTYSGTNRRQVRIATAFCIAVSVLSIHFLFNAVFNYPVSGEGELINEQVNLRLLAITVTLAMVCLFLMTALFIIMLEKSGKKLFNLRLFQSKSDNKPEKYSLQDSLTKLPNRRAFDSHLTSAQQRSKRSGKLFALAYIDLDYFKPINDNYGHHVGDAVLTITAERLNTAVRGCDFVARIGGDEFVAILEEIESEEDARPIAKRIVDSIGDPYFIDHLNIELSCSVGIALYPDDVQDDLEKLMIHADSAMYKAKDQGKNQYKFFDSEIESANDLLLTLQSDLCQAIENNEFSIEYLPKIDCNTLSAVGAEALIRWHHSTKGEIKPNDFLPAAEHFGLIQEINTWVIEECCQTLSRSINAGLDMVISVNLSSYQFQDPNLVKNIISRLDAYNLSPSMISFEIKETAAINNQKQFKLLLDKFKAAGIKVILDDFGLLPMSLTYLLDLQVDEIKIDKSFIAMINKDPAAKALVDAIVKLTHALDFKATAEGVEDEAQQEAVIDLGCDYMQGYLFSMPVSEPQLFELYKKLQFKQLQINFDKTAPKVKKP